MSPTNLRLILVVLLSIFIKKTLHAQAGSSTNCNLADTVNSGILTIANLQARESFRINKQIASGTSIYLLGEIDGAQAGNELVIGAINNNTGIPLWCKRWQPVAGSRTLPNFVLSDDAIYITDIIKNAPPLILLSKLDLDGNFLWSRQYSFGSSANDFKTNLAPTLNFDEGEILISLRLDCNSTNCMLPSKDAIPEGLLTASIDMNGALLWSKMFGVKEDGDYSFFNNRSFGLYKSGKAGEYMLLSRTSGWPYVIPGSPPINNYLWIMATRFSGSSLTIQYGSQYYLPNIPGIQNSGTCTGGVGWTPSFTKLSNGKFMLYSSNINGEIPADQKGFFFCEINNELQPSNGFIASSKTYPCSSTPSISPNGTILLSSAGTTEDSFSITAIKNMRLLYEKKYPKYKIANSSFNSSYLSTIEIPSTGKLFASIFNRPGSSPAYSEIFNDNIYVEKPQCAPANTRETSISPISVYSHSIGWDTIINLQATEQLTAITEENAALSYKTNCQTISLCDNVQLIAPDNVCVGQEFTIILRKGADCHKEIEVVQSGLNAQFLKAPSDSTYLLKATTAGEYNFIARFKDCPAGILFAKKIIGGDDKTPAVKLALHDTVLCKDQTLQITAPEGYRTYSWNDEIEGSEKSILINAPGLYMLETESYCGNRSRDSIKVSYDLSALSMFPQTVTICRSDSASVRLKTDSILSDYSWQPHDQSAINLQNDVFTTWLHNSAVVKVQAITKHNCIVADELTVTVVPPPTTTGIIEKNYDLCIADTLLIEARGNYEEYTWSIGSNGNTVAIAQPGRYSLTIKDSNNCNATVDFNVKEIACKRELYFPSAFTPNNDGLNDLFKAIINGYLPNRFELKIFNRWGQLLYSSNEPTKGWTGYFNGKKQPAGNYIWTCKYAFAGQREATLKGSLLLLN